MLIIGKLRMKGVEYRGVKYDVPIELALVQDPHGRLYLTVDR